MIKRQPRRTNAQAIIDVLLRPKLSEKYVAQRRPINVPK
jgi:hypothetical protein